MPGEGEVAIQIIHHGINHMERKKRIQKPWGSAGVRSSTKGLENVKNNYSWDCRKTEKKGNHDTKFPMN